MSARHGARWSLLLGAAAIAACQPPEAPPRVARVEQLLSGLSSADRDRRTATLAELTDPVRTRLEVHEGLEALAAAAGQYPDPAIAPALVRAASLRPHPAQLPLVTSMFPRYGGPARREALNLLASLSGPDAIAAWIELLERHPFEEQAPLPYGSLRASPRHADLVFPALFRVGQRPELRFDVGLVALAYCQEELLVVDQVEGGRLVAELKGWMPAIRAAQQPGRAPWTWPDPYPQLRAEAALRLDLFACVPRALAVPELRRALELKDLRLVYFAVSSLLAHGEPVSAGVVERLAQSPEVRAWIPGLLGSHDREDLWPRLMGQAELAESQLAQWLSLSQLGQPPDDLVLMHAHEVTHTDGRVLDYYLFAFRVSPPHPLADRGWLAGVAGGYDRAISPTTDHDGAVYSVFEPWEGTTVEDHVARLVPAPLPQAYPDDVDD